MPDAPGPHAFDTSPLNQFWHDLDPSTSADADADTNTPTSRAMPRATTKRTTHPWRVVLTVLLAVAQAAALAALVVGAVWLANRFVNLDPDTDASTWVRAFMAVGFYPLVALILVGRWWSDPGQRGTASLLTRPLALLIVALLVYPNLFIPDLVWCDWWTSLVTRPGLVAWPQMSALIMLNLWILMAGFLVSSVRTTTALVRRATPPPRRGIQPTDEEPS